MMKVSDLRVRINSYIVLVFLVLMSVFGTALVAYYQSLYTRATDRLQKSVMIFHQLNQERFQVLARGEVGGIAPMSLVGNLLKMDEFLFIRLYDAQGKPVLHLFNEGIFTSESVDAKFPAPRVMREAVNWVEENIYLTDPPRVYALGVYSTPVEQDGLLSGYIDYVYDLSSYKNQAFYIGSLAVVFLLLTLLTLAIIVNVLFARFAESNIQGYFRMDGDGQLSNVNALLANMLGYASKADFQADAARFMAANDLVRQVQRIGSGGQSAELELHGHLGQALWCQLNVDSVRGIRGQWLYHDCHVTDISDRKAKEEAERKYRQAMLEANQQLENKVAERTEALLKLQQQTELLARTDTLTQLGNRRDFYDKTQHELNRQKRNNGPASLLMLDIDHFKRVNDTHGHLCGDKVLQVLSRVAQSVVRETDILARLGGEEFAVFMPDTPLHEAVLVAQRLRLAVAGTPIDLPGNQTIHITVSIGATGTLETDVHVDDLLKRADDALYSAKNAGRNRVVCSRQPVCGQCFGAVNGLQPAGVGLCEGCNLDLRSL